MLVDSNEESDYEDSNDEEIQIELRRKMNERGRRVKPSKIKGYVEEIISRLSHNQFRKHFRMLLETSELLEQRISNALSNKNNDGRPMIPIRKQLLASLWLLGTPDSYKSINAQYYKNRKNYFAITLQAVCDAELYFTDCFVGYASSVNDIRVFRNSDLWKEVQNNYQNFFPEEYIIGIKLILYLHGVFLHRNFGNLTEIQSNFNYVYAKTRQIIEIEHLLYSREDTEDLNFLT